MPITLTKVSSITAFSKLEDLHKQYLSKQDLIKIPQFSDKKEELDFYLNLQNPRTGAFMDENYPYFTYLAPTLNMIEHLEILSKEVGQPLKLKYPLKFLDQINSPESLNSYLDDLSSVGKLASKFKAPYIAGIGELVYYEEFERNGLYSFSPEWKQALLKWLDQHQDNKTGYWGPQLRGNGQLLNSGDLGCTFRIVKMFIDEKGKNLNPEFPLRYKEQLFETTLKKLSVPMPQDADSDEMHDWSITRSQGIELLAELWSSAATEQRASAKRMMEDLVMNRFEQFYVSAQGGFSLYPGSKEADLDGSQTALNLLDKVGILSPERKREFWEADFRNISDFGIRKVSDLNESDFSFLENWTGINSIRFYASAPPADNYESGILGLLYPRQTQILDVSDLCNNVNRYLNHTKQTYGMWASKNEIDQQIRSLYVKPVSILDKQTYLGFANDLLKKNNKLFLIGFDALGIPKYRVEFSAE
ncbi:hypothetical protein ACHOLT_11935 [Desulfitobacterium sp. Sab5]|uniref:hypothetical protein n=1 Tax=Desulfitobacterium nosdiversum TaxID=3375356 RepID=UPI003CEACFD2